MSEVIKLFSINFSMLDQLKEKGIYICIHTHFIISERVKKKGNSSITL